MEQNQERTERSGLHVQLLSALREADRIRVSAVSKTVAVVCSSEEQSESLDSVFAASFLTEIDKIYYQLVKQSHTHEMYINPKQEGGDTHACKEENNGSAEGSEKDTAK